MNTNIEISKKAKEEINNLLLDENKGSFFRISVEGGGCSGFKYNFTILDNNLVKETGIFHCY